MIKYVFPYHVLTDTDSTCIFFIFVCKPESGFSDEKSREYLFEVIITNEILSRSDTSDKCWEQFGARDRKLKKKIDYYEIEHVDNSLSFSP